MTAHVLHVMNSAGGGAAMSTLALARALRAHGVRSSAVCHAAGSREELRALDDVFEGRVVVTPLFWWNKRTRAKAWKRPLIIAHDLWSTGALAASTRATLRAADRFGATLLHTSTLVNLEGGFAAAISRRPHVWHVRELIGPAQPYRFPVEGRTLGEVMAALSSVVVANSEATADCFRAWLPPSASLRVVDNGIDLSRFGVRASDGGIRRTRAVVVAMVGSLTTRWKKHSLFVDAVNALVARRPDLEVDARIYGRIPEPRDDYTIELERRAGGRVKLMGFVDEPAELMRAVDVLVHPADGESFGRIAVEAMAASIPVIGVRGGGVAGIVVDGETGLLAPVDDAAGLARLLESVVEDAPLRDRLGRAGRTRAELHYSLAAHARHMIDVYREAARRPVRAARGALSSFSFSP